jgi:hypothetical protein
MAKPQQRCVFCDRTGLSKEDIWSKWTRVLVPTLPLGSHTRGLATGFPGRTRKLDNLKKYQGTVNSIKLRVVCERHCNNGWMSILETQAKPVLTPLIKDERCELGEAAQKILSRWIAVKVIVAEHERRDLVATSSEDRRAVMNGVVSGKWQIWIGRHSSYQWHRGGYNRHALTMGSLNPETGILEPPDNSLVKNTQAVTLGLGALIIYAIFTRVDVLGEMKFTGQLGEGLRQIHPHRGPITWPASAILTDLQIQHITTAFDRFAAECKWIEGS